MATITPRNTIFAVIAVALLVLVASPVCAQGALKLSRQDAKDVKRVEAYLNKLGTLKARFLQLSSNGAQAEGDVYLKRPGRMRIQYDPPMPVEIIATGTFLAYHDKDLEQVSWLGLNSTPAGIILQENLSLSGDILVTGFEREANTLRVTLSKTEDPSMGALTLILSDKPMHLKKWTVIDAQGLTTTVALINARFGLPLANSLFSFTNPYENRDQND